MVNCCPEKKFSNCVYAEIYGARTLLGLRLVLFLRSCFVILAISSSAVTSFIAFIGLVLYETVMF